MLVGVTPPNLKLTSGRPGKPDRARDLQQYLLDISVSILRWPI